MSIASGGPILDLTRSSLPHPGVPVLHGFHLRRKASKPIRKTLFETILRAFFNAPQQGCLPTLLPPRPLRHVHGTRPTARLGLSPSPHRRRRAATHSVERAPSVFQPPQGRCMLVYGRRHVMCHMCVSYAQCVCPMHAKISQVTSENVSR